MNTTIQQVTEPPPEYSATPVDMIGFIGFTVLGIVLRHVVFNQIRVWFTRR